MSTFVPTPAAAKAEKFSAGITDSYCTDGVYKFLGASIVSLNMCLGFNGTPSSLSITLVEDLANGDLFIAPSIPGVYALSLPRGGLGQPIIYEKGIDLTPNSFTPINTPFYFAGICTHYHITSVNVTGRTITVSLVDPRELLCGVQCLLSGFALSQNIGAGLALSLSQSNTITTIPTSRYTGVENLIDVFGYFNYGMESLYNEYGMPWLNIKQAIEAVRVQVNGLWFEFVFTGDTFSNIPPWYRINESIIDIVSLCQTVGRDSGSDILCILRKLDFTGGVVEFRGIKRTNASPLTIGQLQSFCDDRDSIVSYVNIGKEYRNEPTSSIVLGGMRNKMYVALPSTYKQSMHLSPGSQITYTYTDQYGNNKMGYYAVQKGDNASLNAFVQDTQGMGFSNFSSNTQDCLIEDYNAFPADIKVRLFGTSGSLVVPPTMRVDTFDGSPLTSTQGNFTDIAPGAIFPFWGLTPDDHAYPLVEPFLPLDHFLFARTDIDTARVVQRIPACKLDVGYFRVRANPHDVMFLSYDNQADDRPFAYLSDFIPNAQVLPPGYMRGLPLNTEVLRAALVSQVAFETLYSLYYPDIGKSLGMSYPKWTNILQYVNSVRKPDLVNAIKISDLIVETDNCATVLNGILFDSTGSYSKGGHDDQQLKDNINIYNSTLKIFREMIYEQVKQYAQNHMGKQYIVCLPRSLIMNRIWAGLPVPTRVEKPQIEYVVDNRGYWENAPAMFKSFINPPDNGIFAPEDDQIRRKFMAEDTRFIAMAVFDWKPSGNINFNSNGQNKAMFQDLNVSSFRPNRIATGNPSYVCVSCDVGTLPKRPDLAIVNLTDNVMRFDPRDGIHPHGYPFQFFNNFVAKKKGLIKFFRYMLKMDNTARKAFKTAANANGVPFDKYCSDVINQWVEQNYNQFNKQRDLNLDLEIVMDMKACIIPLTSTWVSYGPWYATSDQAAGMVRVNVDDNLVPWNYQRPSGNISWDYNLNIAGKEKLTRSLCVVDYLESASIAVAGFPEIGPGDQLGYNSNLTGISVEFGISEVKTIYNFATYNARPGTFRKADYDNVSISRIDTREKLPDPINTNLRWIIEGANVLGTNQFTD